MDQNRKGKSVDQLEPQYIKNGLKIVSGDEETGEIVYVSQKYQEYVADIGGELNVIEFCNSFFFIDKQDN